jgi:hypothetical protein
MYLLSESCRSLKWTRRQLHTSRTFLNRRSANPWNAFVSKRLNDYNKGPSYCSLHNHQNSKKKIDRGVGERMRLPAFIKAHQAELSSEYYRLTIGQKEALRRSVMNLRQSRVKIVRANPKALQKDVNATFNIMQNEVSTHSRPPQHL